MTFERHHHLQFTKEMSQGHPWTDRKTCAQTPHAAHAVRHDSDRTSWAGHATLTDDQLLELELHCFVFVANGRSKRECGQWTKSIAVRIVRTSVLFLSLKQIVRNYVLQSRRGRRSEWFALYLSARALVVGRDSVVLLGVPSPGAKASKQNRRANASAAQAANDNSRIEWS